MRKTHPFREGKAAGPKQRAFVFVNNRLEGSAIPTIAAVLEPLEGWNAPAGTTTWKRRGSQALEVHARQFRRGPHDAQQSSILISIMKLTPIGTIHSPHQRATGTPIQSACAVGIRGTVEIFPEYAPGLRDLDGFDRIWLVYWFDRANAAQLIVTPYLDTTPHGVFATRAPSRPNPIGLSVVRLLGITGHSLDVEGVDVLDNTPLLDIKPYIPAFDSFQADRVGWCGQSQSASGLADNRFEKDEHA